MMINPPVKVDRLAAITDGVYAIVITLLVLDLKAPEIPDSATSAVLAEDLVAQIPNFIAYTISFVVAAFFWINHRHLFGSLTKCDAKTLILNLVHILFITLLPYTTSLVGRYEQDQLAVVLFTANIGLVSLSLVFMYEYVKGKVEWRVQEDAAEWMDLEWWMVYFGPLLAIVSIGLSFVSHNLSLAVWLLLPLRNFVLMKRLAKGG